MSIETGNIGESKAAEYLIENGYSILEKNYRHKRNEIDLIAVRDELLVFVEVKTKSYTQFGNPEEMVDQAKADRVISAAENYVFEQDWPHNIRFDIVSVLMKGERVQEIKHFEDAFH